TSRLGLAAQVTVIIGSVIAMPFLEEVVFRRVLLDWLQQHTPAWEAGLISVLAFAGAHIAPPLMIYALFLGASLTLARFWFKTTKASFLIHAFNNLVVSTVLLAGLS
ncbi:TPA: CPBP family intramembrane metalloprotease, partial [Corynebacterium striatum]|nr:CPBP family intramembrane metalloprotease [Corynebacterium striatum]HAT6590571.1 CPBP family intramembrane metalloprotease [Corynebacterium striatum]HAT6623593.1 CPBP family intramembrane metalloprotease [Corynebacterium striatum]HAT6654140.1 CPBP family intramembrane metalloprotease [Corynebacterium striatum]HAT6656646.1 CPBP family intramembrane metalloprotease [Corynebacterium striatum]